MGSGTAVTVTVNPPVLLAHPYASIGPRYNRVAGAGIDSEKIRMTVARGSLTPPRTHCTISKSRLAEIFPRLATVPKGRLLSAPGVPSGQPLNECQKCQCDRASLGTAG